MGAGITPGPWQVEGVRRSGDLRLGPTARLHMVGPDGDAVAAVFYDVNTGVGWHDAKAIAAVPTMIAALQLVRSQTYSGDSYTVNDMRVAFLDEAALRAMNEALGAAGVKL